MTGFEVLLVGIVTCLLILVPAGVLLLRPVVKQLAAYLEAAAAAQRAGASKGELAGIRAALERLEAHIAVTEERLDFQEKLLSDRSVRGPSDTVDQGS